MQPLDLHPPRSPGSTPTLLQRTGQQQAPNAPYPADTKDSQRCSPNPWVCSILIMTILAFDVVYPPAPSLPGTP